MAENERCPESVCIDAMRVYDSCSDKDCIEDTRVFFSPADQAVVDTATNVRIKEVKVISVYIDLQPIPFNRGFYSVDMTFFFNVATELYTSPVCEATVVNGISVFSKKVILYGSEGNVKVFTSADDCEGDQAASVPKAVVQVADPIALSARLCDCHSCRGCEPCSVIPERVAAKFGGELCLVPQKNIVYATIGLFIIVQMVRNTQMLIPAYDFCIPDKECVSNSDDPCEIFRQIEFPVNEFFPPSGCGCADKNK